MAHKSISQLQKEIKEFEKKKRDQIKRKELESKLKKLKHPSKFNSKFKRKISVRERIRMGFGERISRGLDTTTGISRPVKKKKHSKKRGRSGMLDLMS